jgi:hypothetical protein
MHWFKFYGSDFLTDPKILSMNSGQRSCWVTLLCLAATSEDNGRIKYLTEQMLMLQSGISPSSDEWDVVVGVLLRFQEMGMIDIDSNGIVTVKNWNKRQETYLTNAERQKRYRERQKSNAEVTRARNDSNARIEENRIEKNINSSEDKSSRFEIVKSSEEEKPPKVKKDTSYLKLYELWGKYPANWKLNRTQMAAAKNLLTEHGLEDCREALAFAAKFKDDPFCPQITSPYDLDSKWDKLAAFSLKRV